MTRAKYIAETNELQELSSMEKSEERWLPVVGYEGLYEVSSIGAVRSADRETKTKNGNTRKSVGRHIAQSTHLGYKSVSLWKNNKTKGKRVHRLVALAFIPNPENKPNINHINGIKDDNRVENLEWCSQTENLRHLFDVLKHRRSDAFKLKQSKIMTERTRGILKRVICIEDDLIFDSASDAAAHYGVKTDTLRSYVYKNRKCPFGKTFEFYGKPEKDRI